MRHPGRGSHGGLIALIICLAIFGYVVGSTARGLHGMHVFGHGEEQDDLFSHLLGQEHDDDRSLNRRFRLERRSTSRCRTEM